MAKPFNICKICGKRRLLNYAELCKRCNNTVEALKLAEIAIEKKQEIQAEIQIQQSEDLKEKHALEEMDELTSEQKKRLVELSPDIKTVDDLDKQGKKTDEETTEDETNEKEKS